MYKNRIISVSIPAYNESKYIRDTISTIPKYVDHIVVIDDASEDNTIIKLGIIAKTNKKLIFLRLPINSGVGASIIKAHNIGISKDADILVVMAGDNQMDPQYLTTLLDSIIDEKYDYVKGNRFLHQKELASMPKMRIIGNIIATFLAKVATGYWSISDPLNGYTAIKVETFKNLNSLNLQPRYDFESSMLGSLALNNSKVKDVFIPAKYKTEVSNINYFKDSIQTIQTLIKIFIRRILYKYTFFNMHPISLFFFFGSILFIFGLLFGIYIIFNSMGPRSASTATVMLSVVPFITGFELILQAIVLDIQNEPK